MSKLYPLKIDAYSHIATQKYKEALEKIAPETVDEKSWGPSKFGTSPPLYDLDHRFRIMDRYEGLMQVIVPAWPAVEEVADPKAAVDLARLANDEMATLVHKYPDRFVAAIGCLPMNNIDAALEEADRTINDLRFRGVLIYTPIDDKPLDSPEFMPLYEKMAHYDLPILIHPMRPPTYADYRTQQVSKYRIFCTFGWPYETTAAMTCIVFGGILEKFPNLKFITHHCGGMVPYFAERIKQFHEVGEMKRGLRYMQGLTKTPLDYYKMFYNDTAIYGNTPALMCAHAFFGADHLLFGIDMPLGDVQHGNRNYRQTINAIEQMDITDAEKKQIYEDNARRIYRLPV
jgi:predicted TIM-barrel fold metal-dependent hydrolase